MVMSDKDIFKKAYVKIRDGIFYGSMNIEDYKWTGIVMDGRVHLWPAEERKIKIYRSF